MNLKGFEYELAIQALKLQGNNADELFKALIQTAEYFSTAPYATEYIKDWDILFSNLAFIANYVEKNSYFSYNVTSFSNSKNALAEIFVDIILNSILLQLNSKRQHKVKNEILYSNLGTNNNRRLFSRF